MRCPGSRWHKDCSAQRRTLEARAFETVIWMTTNGGGFLPLWGLLGKPRSHRRHAFYLSYGSSDQVSPTPGRTRSRLIIVDYLQLMRPTRRQENRQQEISEISRSLKGLARELDVPVIALSQLSRAVEQRQKQIPQLSDLRESGAIEQDSDIVMFLYADPELEQQNAIQLIVAKQRNGPTGSVKIFFSREYCRFDDLDVIHQP